MSSCTAVHSFWFRPFLQRNADQLWAGYPEERFFWYAWVLSFEGIRRLFPQFHLFTDSFGKERTERLELPYNSVSTVLDSIGDLDTALWSYPKLLVYSLQQSAFVHFDTDVIPWRPLPDRILSAQVAVQSLEFDRSQKQFYASLVEPMRQTLASLPGGYKTLDLSFDDVTPLNCGIFGGTHLTLIRAYASESMKIFDDDREGWRALKELKTPELFLYNAAVEQLNLALWCKQEGVVPECLFTPQEILEERAGQRSLGYTHLLGPAKRDRQALALLEQRLDRQFPRRKQLIDRICAG